MQGRTAILQLASNTASANCGPGHIKGTKRLQCCSLTLKASSDIHPASSALRRFVCKSIPQASV
jgi:hypothetical protein